MKLWLDEDLCSGCGCCTTICPEVFGRTEQNLAVVLVNGMPRPDIKPAPVPIRFRSNVLKAAQECPGEIIFVER